MFFILEVRALSAGGAEKEIGQISFDNSLCASKSYQLRRGSSVELSNAEFF